VTEYYNILCIGGHRGASCTRPYRNCLSGAPRVVQRSWFCCNNNTKYYRGRMLCIFISSKHIIIIIIVIISRDDTMYTILTPKRRVHAYYVTRILYTPGWVLIWRMCKNKYSSDKRRMSSIITGNGYRLIRAQMYTR